ncbi:hypothetical protein KAX17_14315 [Candidatus Bipolaricaulota bacterium]|nr:hypothetical protein [Candidatus Bipolaricaulota bacterium]MCK4598432.1 hypothetical protein [Candidatus Bipolaricaulota bacterium]
MAKKWAENDVRIWLLETCSMHKDASPDNPYVYIDLTKPESDERPSGEAILAAYNYASETPFAEHPQNRLVLGHIEKDAKGRPTALRVKINANGIDLLRKLKSE